MSMSNVCIEKAKGSLGPQNFGWRISWTSLFIRQNAKKVLSESLLNKYLYLEC